MTRPRRTGCSRRRAGCATGYRLFELSTLAGSSGRGWFGPLGESNALFMQAALWAELGGLDEEFALPGGGLVNHDLLRRACELPGAELIVLLGEGTFHQIHGGAATSGRYTREEAGDEYERARAPILAAGAPSPSTWEGFRHRRSRLSSIRSAGRRERPHTTAKRLRPGSQPAMNRRPGHA